MSGGGHVDPSNKKIALQIAILAVVLAFSESLGKGAQTAARRACNDREAQTAVRPYPAKAILHKTCCLHPTGRAAVAATKGACD